MIQRRDWSLSGVAAAAGALAPIAACPACWPAYLGLASAMGLGVVAEPGASLGVTSALLAIALLSIGFGVRRRRGYGPVLVAVAGASVLLVGRLIIGGDAAINA